jgi:hypothetical protein
MGHAEAIRQMSAGSGGGGCPCTLMIVTDIRTCTAAVGAISGMGNGMGHAEVVRQMSAGSGGGGCPCTLSCYGNLAVSLRVMGSAVDRSV